MLIVRKCLGLALLNWILFSSCGHSQVRHQLLRWPRTGDRRDSDQAVQRLHGRLRARLTDRCRDRYRDLKRFRNRRRLHTLSRNSSGVAPLVNLTPRLWYIEIQLTGILHDKYTIWRDHLATSSLYWPVWNLTIIANSCLCQFLRWMWYSYFIAKYLGQAGQSETILPARRKCSCFPPIEPTWVRISTF